MDHSDAKALPKTHAFYQKKTRRFFPDEENPTKYIVADGVITGYYPEESPIIYKNAHVDGDLEDLENMEVEEAVEAFESQAKTPKPKPSKDDEEKGSPAEIIGEGKVSSEDEEESDGEITEWPDDLQPGQWSEDGRFYSSLDDESLYKIAKRKNLEPGRLLKSHKEYYPSHLNLHSKLQAGTLLDFKLYEDFDDAAYEATIAERKAAEARAKEERRLERERKKGKAGKKTKNAKGGKGAGQKSSTRRNKSRSAQDAGGAQANAGIRRSSRAKAAIRYTELDDDAFFEMDSSSESSSDDGGGVVPRASNRVSRTAAAVAAEKIKSSTKNSESSASGVSEYETDTEEEEEESSEESTGGEEESSEGDEDVEPLIHVDQVFAREKKSLREWDRKCANMTTTHITRGSIFAQQPRTYREGEDEENEERYLIKWKGYSHLHVSWETLSDIHSMCNANSAGKVDRFIDNVARVRTSADVQLTFPSCERIIAMDNRDKWFDTRNPPCEICGGSEDNDQNPALLCDGCEFGCCHLECLKLDKVPDGDWFCTTCVQKNELRVSGKDLPEVLKYSDKMFLVKWTGLQYNESTWESAADLDDNQMISGFLARSKFPRKFSTSKPLSAQQALKQVDQEVYKNGNTLRSYQCEGVKWLVWNYIEGRNSLLADEMGLGKTVQSVSFLKHIRDFQGAHGPFLIVAPLSTIPHWQREFLAWTDMNCVVLHGDPPSRDLIFKHEWRFQDEKNPRKYLGKKDDLKFDVIVTTYEGINTCYDKLKRVAWKALVVDEAHRLKNRRSKLMEQLVHFKFECTLLLSGTPIQNSMDELWSLLNFISPQEFNDVDEFSEKFGNMNSAKELDELHALIEKYFLRRLKGDVEKIPPREETLIEVELTVEQKRYYRAIYEQNRKYLYRGLKNTSKPSLMNISMELRKCCNHPFLIRGVEDAMMSQAEPGTKVEDLLVRASGKCVLLDKLLPKLKAEGHRVLIFSQMVRMLDIIADYLLYRSFPYEMIDGRQKGNERQTAIDRFTNDPEILVMLLSTRAGGVGINLTAADTVIIFDSDWNPQNDIQAMARCHRIGQTKQVQVYRLLSTNTYEMEMFRKASKKLGLDQAVLHKMEQEGAEGAAQAVENKDKELELRKAKFGLGASTGATEKANSEKNLNKKDVEELLKHGAYNLLQDDKSDEKSKTFCEADIEEILKTKSTRINVAQTSEEGAASSMSQAGSKFSRASFVSEGSGNVDINDPDFWKKIIGVADVAEEDSQIVSGKRKRFAGSYKEMHEFDALTSAFLDSTDDENDGDSDDAAKNAEGNASVIPRWVLTVKERLLAHGLGKLDVMCEGLVSTRSVDAAGDGGASTSSAKDNGTGAPSERSVDDVYKACVAWIAIWSLAIVESRKKRKSPRSSPVPRSDPVQPAGSNPVVGGGNTVNKSDKPVAGGASQTTQIVVDVEMVQSPPAREAESEEDLDEILTEKLENWLPEDALDTKASVVYIIGSSEDTLRAIVKAKQRTGAGSHKTIESEIRAPTNHLSQWLNNRLSRFSTSKLLPKIYKWLAKGESGQIRWRVRAELKRSNMQINSLAEKLSVTPRKLFGWLYNRKPNLRESLPWGTSLELALLQLKNTTKNDFTSVSMAKLCEEVLRSLVEKYPNSSSDGAATVNLVVPPDMLDHIIQDEISGSVATKRMNRVSNFLVLNQIASDKARTESKYLNNRKNTSTSKESCSTSSIDLWSWLPQPSGNVKLPRIGWEKVHDLALVQMVIQHGLSRGTCEILRDYFFHLDAVDPIASNAKLYWAICANLPGERSELQLGQNPKGLKSTWSDWRKRFGQLCNAFLLMRQKRETKLKTRLKNIEKGKTQARRAFEKKIMQKKRKLGDMMPKFLCVKCSASLSASHTACPVCGALPSKKPFIPDHMILINISRSVLLAGELFSVKQCWETQLTVVDTITDSRCPPGLRSGDIVVKIGKDNVFQNNWSTEDVRGKLSTFEVGTIEVARVLPVSSQVRFLSDGIKQFNKSLPEATSKLDGISKKMQSFNKDLRSLKKTFNRLYPKIHRIGPVGVKKSSPAKGPSA